MMERFNPSSRVLVTGANGHVAQHFVSQLLALDSACRPQVRATVRSDASAAGLRTVFADHIADGTLEIVTVPNIAEAGVFDAAVQGCTHIAHIASPLVVGAKDVERDVLIPAIQGTVSLLRSALKVKSLQAVVVTSSMAAVQDPMKDLCPEYIYTPSDWNPIDYATVADPDLDLSPWPARYRPFITYMASKKLAERAAWDFYESEKPSWRMSVVNPTYIGGPYVLPLRDGVNSLSYSTRLIWDVSTSKPEDKLPILDFPHWVDVRDVADAHIRALLAPKADGERFILAIYKVRYSDIADVVRRKLGWTPSNEQQILDSYTIESKNCQQVLGLTEWRKFDDMVLDGLNQIQGGSNRASQ